MVSPVGVVPAVVVVVVDTSARLENRLVGVAVALVCRRNHRVEDRWEVAVVAFEEVVLLLVEDIVGVVGEAVDNFGRRSHRLRSHRCSRRHRVAWAWILVELADLEVDRRGLVAFLLDLDTVDMAQDAPC